MTDVELIQKIRQLKHLKPRNDWVVLAKRQILSHRSPELGREPFSAIFTEWFRFVFRPRVFVPVVSVSIIVAVLFLGQFSLPGEPLHPVKKIAETTHETFVSEEKKPEFYLDLAEKRAAELKEIVTTKQAAKLSPAIKGYQETLKKAADSLAISGPKEPDQTIAIAKKFTQLKEKNKEIEENLNIEFKELGEIEEKTLACLRGEIENTRSKLSVLVGQEIQDLENSSLTESQQAVLDEVKQLYQAEDYAAALEKILLLPHP